MDTGAKHYVELRESLLKKIAGFPPFIPQNGMFEFMADNTVDQNYYAWYMRYVQMACFELKVDLSLASLGVRLYDEDHLLFIVNADGREAHFTGRVVGHQIVLAYRQIPALQEGSTNEEIHKDN